MSDKNFTNTKVININNSKNSEMLVAINNTECVFPVKVAVLVVNKNNLNLYGDGDDDMAALCN